MFDIFVDRYHMAESMDTQLKQMSEDLKEIIEHLNESSKVQDTTDPVSFILVCNSNTVCNKILRYNLFFIFPTYRKMTERFKL